MGAANKREGLERIAELVERLGTIHTRLYAEATRSVLLVPGTVPGGSLEASRNVVGRDATCAANNPAVTVNGFNVVGRSNTCG